MGKLFNRNYYIVKLFFLLYITVNLFSAGIKTSFSELLLENMQIGTTYSFINDFNYPYHITYYGSVKTEFIMKVINAKKRKKGFIDLPDFNWVSVLPKNCMIFPHQTKPFDIKITIPNDRKLIGKKFCFSINTVAKPTLGEFLGVGLVVNNTIFFTVADKESYKSQNNKSADQYFELQPLQTHISNIKTGKKKKAFITIFNQNKYKEEYMIRIYKVKNTTAQLQQNYDDIPDSSFIKLNSQRISINADASKKVEYTIQIPDKKKYKNKKFMFILSVENNDKKRIAFSRYVRVFLHTMN